MPSSVTCVIFRLLGHKIGRNVKLPVFSYIYAEEIYIGNDVDIRQLVLISVFKLSIGNNAIISFGTQIKGDGNFSSGDNSFIGAQCVVHCDEDVKIGFYSGLGPRCTVYTHGSFLPVTDGYPVKFEKVVLEDYVWTGMVVTILPGVYIESNCIINPGVVLKSRIKSGTFVECSPTAFRELNLNRLLKFSKKTNLYYHEQILNGFLTSHQIKYKHNETDNSFVAGNKYVFRYFPEDNIIVLIYNKNKKITYDLKNYYTDYSNLKIHKDFLYFLRRRFGLTLRTNY